jgi:hypothetical protein
LPQYRAAETHILVLGQDLEIIYGHVIKGIRDEYGTYRFAIHHDAEIAIRLHS